MAKFINKKEQVYDLRLTSYGHYLLSIGTFKPVYYAFYDNNILYDKRYTNPNTIEGQNDVGTRISEETQYLETQVLFEDVEEAVAANAGGTLNVFEVDLTPTLRLPRKDVFRFDTAIGDAHLDGPKATAPAWKVAMLDGQISSSVEKDYTNESLIPQVNITANYRKKIIDSEFNLDPYSVQDLIGTTRTFIDTYALALEADTPMVYVEEVNTALLTENFEIEVFNVLTSSTTEQLERKFFEQDKPQIVDGIMVSPTKQRAYGTQLTSASVEYYFDVMVDTAVDQKVACRGSEIFNKSSYYIDIDFDCAQDQQENSFYDIYGSVTEPEVCLD